MIDKQEQICQDLKELFYKVQKGYHPSRATREARILVNEYTDTFLIDYFGGSISGD